MSEAGLARAFDAMAPNLEASPVIREFLEIIRKAPALPAGMRLAQPLLVRAAVDVLPGWAQARLGLVDQGLAPWERPVVRAMGRAADRLALETLPPAQACVRMGLPADWLYRGPTAKRPPE